MFKSYFTIAIRNLWKRRDYSILNIIGLSIGISCCLLIFGYVAYEKSYDNFLPDAGRLYRLRLDSYQQGRLNWQSATVYPAIGPSLKKDFQEIEQYCRLSPAVELLLSDEQGNLKFNEQKGYYADPSFLSMFHIHILQGESKTALEGMDKIMLSRNLATKYFPHEMENGQSILGKILTFHSAYSTRPFQITGVFDPLPLNSHLVVNYLVSYPTVGFFSRQFGDNSHPEENSWGWYQFYTYLQLKPGTDISHLEAKFRAFCDRYINSQEDLKANHIRNEIHLISVHNIHLGSHSTQEAEVNGNPRMVSFLFLIAFFIIGIAWVNYINLATARSMERAKEVGVRKLVGAGRSALIIQFFLESLVINFISVLIALVVTYAVAPWFVNLTGHLHQGFYLPGRFWLLAVVVFFIGSFLSGVYPALVLSGFKPITVLKGKFKYSATGWTLRKVLIVVQFSISIILIAGTIVIYRQVSFMRSQPLGVNIDQMIVMDGPASLSYNNYESIYQTFKNSVQQINGVRNVSFSSSVMGKENTWVNDVWRPDIASPHPVTLHFLAVDYDFIPAYEMKLIAGRNFSRDFATDTSAVVLNESAVRALGFSNPESAIGQKLTRGGPMTIIGVIHDYHAESLEKSIDPTLMLLIPAIRYKYSIKTATANFPGLITQIRASWNKFFPNDPFNYYFLDDSFDAQYRSDIQFGKLFGIFAAWAIIIACMGLLGLSAYSVLLRRKEIGIRKVLGASLYNVFEVLSKDFLKLVFVAIIIASPVAWYFMSRWLENYAYRIHPSWWMFGLAGVGAILIAVITISYQTIRAALKQPVESLRTE